VTECPICAEPLAPGVQHCPHCEPEGAQEPVYDLPDIDTKIPANWQSLAVYTLETTARCPHCREPIRTIQVLRMTRTQVSFTSTLPRSGRAMVCPQCERILSIELSTFV
jgi:hypothetical protein